GPAARGTGVGLSRYGPTAAQLIVKPTWVVVPAAMVKAWGLGLARLQLPCKPESVTAWSPAAIPVAVTLSLAPMVPDCPVSRVSVYPAGRFDPVVVVVTVRLPVAGGDAAQLIAKLGCAASPPRTLTGDGLAAPTVTFGPTPPTGP